MLIKGLVPALLLIGLLLLVCGLAGFSAFKAGTDLTVPVPVALVDEEDSLISRLCIGIAEDADFTDQLLAIEKCGREEALAGMDDGRFAAAIILPEDYTGRIMSGQECVGTIILSEKAAYMSGLVARIAKLAERLLAAGQYGVFAGEELIFAEGDAGWSHDMFLALSNTRLIEAALELENEAFETVTLPYSGFGTDVLSHFALCWTCFLLSLCGMFFSALYTVDRDESLRDRLRSCGVGNASFALGKVLWPFVFRIVLGAGILALLGEYLSVNTTHTAVFCGIAALLLCSCFTSGLALAFPKGAPWIVLLISLAGLFFCGGLLPLQFIPGFFFSIGKVLPLGAMAGALSPVFGGSFSLSAFAAALIWAVLAMAAAFVSLSVRRGKEGEE